MFYRSWKHPREIRRNGKYEDIFSEEVNNVTPRRYNENKANAK